VSGSLKRVLLVEDDPDVQVVTEFALSSVGGFSVVVCGSGREALDRVEAFAPDLILLDVMMAGMDGPTTLQALARIPTVVDIPVVFMTAKVQPSETARYREMGSAAVIGKPFDPMTLADTLRAIWERHRR
jgi:two-component system OmpR family response regulator